MEEIFHTFAIDWRLIGIQLINFGLLLALLSYFLYKPVLRVIDERRAKIEQGVKDAEAAKSKLAGALSERGSIIEAAHKEASAVAVRAKEHADKKAADIVRQAELKGGRIVDDAEKEGALLKERLYQESQAEIAKTALLAAEKILKERA